MRAARAIVDATRSGGSVRQVTTPVGGFFGRIGAMVRPVILALVVLAGPAAASDNLRLSLSQMTDPARMALFEHTLGIEDADLARDVRAAYAARGYAPVWTAPESAALRGALMAALDGAGQQGLAPGRYDAAGLRAQARAIRHESDRAALEVALMAAFLGYARDLSSGQIEPKKADSGIVREIDRPDPAELVAGLLAAPSPRRFLRDLIPADPAYLTLLRERLRLAAALDQTPPAPVPAASLAPGDSGAAVLALRDRLVALGYLAPTRRGDYDGAMADAVRRLQVSAGLGATGTATEATIKAANRPLSDRLADITVAMERLRWMRGQPRDGRHIWVNIPDFTARLYDGDRLVFETVTVVGENKPDHRTPEFSEMMTHMVVNPSWNVPHSITVKEYLPKLRANPSAAGHLQVIDRRGRVVPRDKVNFNAASFPYSLRQPPAARNALGQVKFMFPNPWNIYLHDTPSRSLFKETVRAYSHGCIRVEAPVDLAAELLAPQSDDPRGLYRANLRGGAERSIPLDPPIPVHLVYFTAWPEQGEIIYRRDVYGRDDRVRAALVKAGVAFAGAGD